MIVPSRRARPLRASEARREVSRSKDTIQAAGEKRVITSSAIYIDIFRSSDYTLFQSLI